ncbi:MAG: hypothetical protein ACLR1T_16390 [Evtepia gabavorous]
MDSSTFDFQGNTVGMALSYFDEDANYKNCKLDVSNCEENGIFMRQDNAAIWGLYFDSVNIHCVNAEATSGIAIRFHAGPFRFDNSVMTIDRSTTTGLWIYDGWDTERTDSGISNSTIMVKNVPTSLFQPNGRPSPWLFVMTGSLMVRLLPWTTVATQASTCPTTPGSAVPFSKAIPRYRGW